MNILNYTEAHHTFRKELIAFLEKELVPEREQWEKDHIVPWDAAWRITQLFGGDVRFVLASSGHIAGIINPPGGKGNYWTRDKDSDASSPEQWLQSATKHEGSWWPDWSGWLAARSGEKGPPPPMGSKKHPPIADAPGTYVLEK